MKWYSLYGTGTTIHSIERTDDGRTEFTVWLSMFWVPLAPITSWSGVYAGELPANGLWSDRHCFSDLVRILHNWRRIGRTLVLAVAVTVAALAPIAYMLFRINGRGATNLEMVFVFAFTAWPVVLVVAMEKARTRQLQGAGGRVSPKTQKMVKPNAAELNWIHENVQSVQGLIRELNVATHGVLADPSALDAAYAAWYAQHDRETENPNAMINAFGLAFGQYLVANLALTWAVVSDGQGTEIAVHGQPGDILVFPLNLVAKRYTKGEMRFFQSLYDQTRQQIEGLRRTEPGKM